jgi:ubiquinone/menaquinone biosynthesis C-methylase UbiE
MNDMMSSFSYYINSIKGIPSIYKFPKIESIINKVYPKNNVNYSELESAFNYMLMGGNLSININLIKEYFKFKSQSTMQSYFSKIKNTGRKLTFTLEQIKSVDDLTSLENVVGKFLYGRKRNYEQNKTVRNLVKAYSNKDDITFYNEIHKYYNPVDFDRSKARMKEFDEINIKIKEVKMYLDFGGGDGANAYALGKKLNLEKGQVFVSDIESWFGNANVDKFKELCTYRYLKTYLLPFETESFDLITMFQVLHHIENTTTTLKELYRILKVGGIFYIREHDCNSPITATLIDIEHSLQECSKKSNIDYEYLQTYYANYFSREELREKLFEVGFKEYIKDGKHVTSENYGETRYYITVWTK